MLCFNRPSAERCLPSSPLINALFMILLISAYVVTYTVWLPFAGKAKGQSGLGAAKLGAVASESSICSGFGTEMLEMGGNAADAVGGSICD
jgi:gamma-glutamyltranspeptidase / glutathione hydrolase